MKNPETFSKKNRWEKTWLEETSPPVLESFTCFQKPFVSKIQNPKNLPLLRGFTLGPSQESLRKSASKCVTSMDVMYIVIYIHMCLLYWKMEAI